MSLYNIQCGSNAVDHFDIYNDNTFTRTHSIEGTGSVYSYNIAIGQYRQYVVYSDDIIIMPMPCFAKSTMIL